MIGNNVVSRDCVRDPGTVVFASVGKGRQQIQGTLVVGSFITSKDLKTSNSFLIITFQTKREKIKFH